LCGALRNLTLVMNTLSDSCLLYSSLLELMTSLSLGILSFQCSSHCS
jgi:hypothetical protein